MNVVTLLSTILISSFSRDTVVENLLSISPEHEEERNIIAAKFFCALYRFKYSACFKQSETLPALMSNGSECDPRTLIECVRRNTWHKTILDQNTLPTYEAICYRSRRTTLVLHIAAGALNAVTQEVDLMGMVCR